MRSPLALTLGLLIGATAIDVAAQDTWRGEQRMQNGQRGGERAQGGRGADYGGGAQHDRGGDYGGRTQRDNGAHWNNQRGNTYWDREQRQAQGGSHYPAQPVDSRQQYRDDGRRHPAEANGFNSGYRGYDRPDYTSQQRDHRGRGNDRWDHRDRWENRGLPSHRRDWNHDRYEANRYRHDDWRSNWRHSDWRRNWYHGWSGSRYRAATRYVYPHGYSYYRWSIGYRVPAPFLVSSYYVDYRPYGLAPPPYGCRWLRVDGDLLLVELVSGEIVDILYNFYY